jgi:hypothetical protein
MANICSAKLSQEPYLAYLLVNCGCLISCICQQFKHFFAVIKHIPFLPL